MQNGLALNYTKIYLTFTSFTFTLARRQRNSILVYFTLFTVKPVKLATVANRPPVTVVHTFTLPANYFGVLHGHYSITWPRV